MGLRVHHKGHFLQNKSYREAFVGQFKFFKQDLSQNLWT